MIPTRAGNARHANQGNRDLGRDCAVLGIAHRHQHCTRHTFIRLAEADGALRDTLRYMTHRPPKAAFDGYAGPPWVQMCAELRKVRLERRAVPDGVPVGEGG